MLPKGQFATPSGTFFEVYSEDGLVILGLGQDKDKSHVKCRLSARNARLLAEKLLAECLEIQSDWEED